MPDESYTIKAELEAAVHALDHDEEDGLHADAISLAAISTPRRGWGGSVGGDVGGGGCGVAAVAATAVNEGPTAAAPPLLPLLPLLQQLLMSLLLSLLLPPLASEARLRRQVKHVARSELIVIVLSSACCCGPPTRGIREQKKRDERDERGQACGMNRQIRKRRTVRVAHRRRRRCPRAHP